MTSYEDLNLNGAPPRVTLDQFQLVVESAPLALIMADGEGQILFVSAKVETMFGYRRKELLGRQIEILIAERFRGPREQTRESLFVTSEPKTIGSDGELFCVRKDCSEFAV